MVDAFDTQTIEMFPTDRDQVVFQECICLFVDNHAQQHETNQSWCDKIGDHFDPLLTNYSLHDITK